MAGKPGRKHTNQPQDVFKQINMTAGPDACWEWKGRLRKGTGGELRPIFSIKGDKYYAYRVVWELYNGRKLEHGEVIRHQCDNTRCCNPKHLLVGVQKDNVQDMVKRERVGENNIVIKKIMSLLETGATAVFVTKYMREKYDVEYDESVIRKIRSRRIYKHLEWPWGDERAAERIARIAGDPSSAILDK